MSWALAEVLIPTIFHLNPILVAIVFDIACRFWVRHSNLYPRLRIVLCLLEIDDRGFTLKDQAVVRFGSVLIKLYSEGLFQQEFHYETINHHPQDIVNLFLSEKYSY